MEHSGDTAYVACTPGASTVEATYTEAATYDAACDGHADRWLAPCRAAFHGLCAARGALTGFGPLENSGDVAWVACITAETP